MHIKNFRNPQPEIRDYGPEPLLINIEQAAKTNKNYRSTLWTGRHLQITLMSIPVGGDIGIEMHGDVDQFIRIESGRAQVMMGRCPEDLCRCEYADSNYAIVVPAGTWHNVVNAGNSPLKLYSIYAPTQHPFGTVHKTKDDADHDGH